MKKTVAVFNNAGGTGKSTITQNLSHLISLNGHRVLAVDLDPQASLTRFSRIDPFEIESTVEKVLLPEKIDSASEIPIMKTNFGYDLIPANIFLARAEVLLAGANYREFRLRRALEHVKHDFDYVVIDCPPSLGYLASIALASASDVLTPVQTQAKAVQATDCLLWAVERARIGNERLRILGFIPFAFDKRRGLDTRSLAAIEEQLPAIAPVFPPIPTNTEMAEAAEKQEPLAVRKPNHPALESLRVIVDEICGSKLKEVANDWGE